MSLDNNNIATAGNEVKTVENKEYELDLIQLFSVVARKLWILVLVGLLAAVGAYFYTVKNIAPIYVSTSRVYIISRQSSFSASLNDFNTADSVKVDFKVLINSNEIFREVLRNVGEDPANYRSLRGKVSLDNNNSRFVDISVTDTDPLRAKKLVDAFADVSRIKAKALMGVEEITIEEYGEVPTSPVGPNLQNNMIVAAIIGIILAAAVIIVLHLLNDSITSVDELEKTLGLCVLGAIPDVASLRRSKGAAARNDRQRSK